MESRFDTPLRTAFGQTGLDANAGFQLLSRLLAHRSHFHGTRRCLPDVCKSRDFTEPPKLVLQS